METMMNNNEPENKMGVMPVNRLLVSMAAPMALSMLVQAMYNIVDSVFVSHVSEAALSAVSLAFPVQNVIMALSAGTAVGVNALISRSLGCKHYDEADRYAGTGIFLAGVGAFLMLLFGALFSRWYFTVQVSDPDIIRYGTDYLSIVTMLSFGVFWQVLGERLLASTGRTFYSMITQSVGAIINLILDPIMIFGLLGFPRLETAGAAIATVIGQFTAVGLTLLFNVKVNKELHLRLRYVRLNGVYAKNILAIGVPSMFMLLVGSVMNYGMNQILLVFNSTAVAVFGIYYKQQSFVFMPVFGLNNAMVPIVAYNYGARRRKRIVDTIKLSILYATLLMLVGFCLFMTIPEAMLRLYNASDTMLAIGVPALRIMAVSFLFAGFCIISGSVFQALGNGGYALIVSVCRQMLALLPIAYLFSLGGNLKFVWFAFPLAEIVSVTVSAVMLKRIYRKKISPLPD
jgi:putative MATE family efflux protein